MGYDRIKKEIELHKWTCSLDGCDVETIVTIENEAVVDGNVVGWREVKSLKIPGFPNSNSDDAVVRHTCPKHTTDFMEAVKKARVDYYG